VGANYLFARELQFLKLKKRKDRKIRRTATGKPERGVVKKEERVNFCQTDDWVYDFYCPLNWNKSTCGWGSSRGAGLI